MNRKDKNANAGVGVWDITGQFHIITLVKNKNLPIELGSQKRTLAVAIEKKTQRRTKREQNAQILPRCW